MSGHQLTGGWVIWTSLFIALLLSITPLPYSIMSIRPLWVALFFICWSLLLPHRVSLVAAWLFGILLDVMVDSLLGQNALVLVFIVYVTLLFQPKIKTRSILTQTFFITIILTLAQLIQLWIYALTGTYPNRFNIFNYILPIITSAIIFPWLAAAIRALKIRMAVN